MTQDQGQPCVGDIGYEAIIECWETNTDGTASTRLDFTSAILTTKTIVIRDPDGAIKFSGAATFSNGTGSDGRIGIVTGNIFDQPGPWTKEGFLTFSSPATGPHSTGEIEFQVRGTRLP